MKFRQLLASPRLAKFAESVTEFANIILFVALMLPLGEWVIAREAHASMMAAVEETNARMLVQYHREQKACLTEALYYEIRGRTVAEIRVVGITLIARATDPDPQWPKTVCGVVNQKGALSYKQNKKLMAQPVDQAAWQKMATLASEVYDEAWSKQLLPGGAECVRSFKVSDEKLASLSKKNLKQLGITSKRAGLTHFERTQREVLTLGETSFYADKDGCRNPLPAQPAA